MSFSGLPRGGRELAGLEAELLRLLGGGDGAEGEAAPPVPGARDGAAGPAAVRGESGGSRAERGLERPWAGPDAAEERSPGESVTGRIGRAVRRAAARRLAGYGYRAPLPDDGAAQAREDGGAEETAERFREREGGQAVLSGGARARGEERAGAPDGGVARAREDGGAAQGREGGAEETAERFLEREGGQAVLSGGARARGGERADAPDGGASPADAAGNGASSGGGTESEPDAGRGGAGYAEDWGAVDARELKRRLEEAERMAKRSFLLANAGYAAAGPGASPQGAALSPRAGAGGAEAAGYAVRAGSGGAGYSVTGEGNRGGAYPAGARRSGALGTDMQAVSDFFRRASRRYDGGYKRY